MAPNALTMTCSICGSLHTTSRIGKTVKAFDVQCRNASHVLIAGFAYYNGLREMVVSEVVRDLKFLRSASFPATEKWRLK
jgi:hypothetical protein